MKTKKILLKKLTLFLSIAMFIFCSYQAFPFTIINLNDSPINTRSGGKLLFNSSDKVLLLNQSRVYGKIVDSEGIPLSGATVIEKGTANGTTANFDGNFSILLVDKNAVLIVSFIGFVTQEVDVSGKNSIDITMNIDAESLDEVVVVGYGVQKKVSITNAVSNIGPDDIRERNSTNVIQALQGKLPGLTVIDRGGEPGAQNLVLRIRGVTSLNDNQPLVLVDEVPADLSTVNPADIQSITVLKDAAAAAIYGSRAAAGVILVTTKRPSAGKMTVSYDGFYGVAVTNNKPVHMGAVDYMRMQNTGYTNTFGSTLFTEDQIQQWPKNYANDPENYPKPNTWLDELYEAAPQNSHTVTLSGGSEAINSRVSIRYLNEDGIIPTFNFNLGEIRANTNFKVSDKLRFNTNLNYRSETRNRPYNPWGLPPNWNLLNWLSVQNSQWGVPRYSDGSYGLSQDGVSPLILAEQAGTSTFNTGRLTGIIKADYDIFDGLTISTQYWAKVIGTDASRFRNKFRFEDKRTGLVNEQNISTLNESRTKSKEDGLDLKLNYNKIIDKHNISALLGYSWIQFESNELSAYRQGFYNNDLTVISQGLLDGSQSNGGSASEWGLNSYFGRINYDFDERYLLEVNARHDGSSRFSQGNRYGFFPSFSFGWRISNEEFWGSLVDTITELKLRGSWGQTGNQTVDLWTYIPTYNQSNYIFNEGLATGFRQTNQASDNLSWETTSQVNIGLDASIYNNMVTFSADIYKKRTEDILLAVPIPAIIGLNPTNQNAGIIENTGFELMLAGSKVFGDFNAGLSLNANYNQNKVIDLAGTGPFISAFGNSDYRTITTEGSPINSYYGFETDGFFQSQEDVDNYATWDGSVGPGDVKYVDQNNDGSLTPDDFVIFGNELPNWTFNSNMSFGWKNLQLDLFWQGAAGSEKLVTGMMLEMGIWNGFTHEIYTDYWTESNRDAEFPRPTKFTMKNVQVSDRTMVDGSYLRLKTARISYNFPKPIISKLNLSNATIYLTSTNVMTFSQLNKFDIDPEQEGRGPEAFLPQTSVSTIGLNVTF
jgi:TonB-linked SusC/RagA family outer membrane protein